MYVVEHGDIDPIETAEWLDALASVSKVEGVERAHYLIQTLAKKIGARQALSTPYCNTIAVQDEARLPGDLAIEQRIRALIRWNAMAMVVRAQKVDSSLGGHIGTFASSATLYDVGFNHFWRGLDSPCGGDLIFIQGHASPGIYARAFLQGDVTEEQLIHF